MEKIFYYNKNSIFKRAIKLYFYHPKQIWYEKRTIGFSIRFKFIFEIKINLFFLSFGIKIGLKDFRNENTCL